MKFAITGHQGLIGGHFKEALERQGHECALAVDLRETKEGKGFLRNIEDMPARASEYKDAGIERVYAFAAPCTIRESRDPKHRARYTMDLIEGTERIVDFCKGAGIPEIFFASSSRVLYPELNPYVIGKIAAEKVLKEGIQDGRIERFQIHRYSAVCGPGFDRTGRFG